MSEVTLGDSGIGGCGGAKTAVAAAQRQLVAACGAGGDWGWASLFSAEMKGGRTWPNVTTYSAGITACGKGGEVEEALRMFSELRQWLKPDVISYRSSISARGAGWDWGWASLLLVERP